MTTIHVTQADIDDGVRDECERCPIALAVSRKCKPEIIAEVGDLLLCVFNRDDESRYNAERLLLPDSAQRFIANFDNEESVESFSFPLNLPEWALLTP